MSFHSRNYLRDNIASKLDGLVYLSQDEVIYFLLF